MRSLRNFAAFSLFLVFAPVLAPAQSTDALLTPRTFVDVSRKVLPAVVSIEVEVPISQKLQDDYNVDNMEDFLHRLFEDQQSMQRFRLPDYGSDDFGYRGTGSGVIVARKDDWYYVVTNRHVVGTNERAQYSVSLTLSDGSEKEVVEGDRVEWVGDDSLTDIAVLRLRAPEDGTTLPTAEFADSDAVEVGEWVLALGNPLELGNSVSQGIISAKNRSVNAVNRIDNHLQTTAVINPGNSGGPLVNLEGKIVGINNAIATDTGRWAGIGFAIPGNLARHVAERLIEDGKISRGYLGIAMLDVSDVRSSAYALKLKNGVSVEDVRPGTPAQKAGLQRGDIVVEVNGEKVSTSQDLLAKIATQTAGDSVTLKVMRYDEGESEELDFTVELMERPSERELASEAPSVPRWFDRFGSDRGGSTKLGLKLVPGEEDGREGLRIEDIEQGSPADRAGLRPGDFIFQINGIDINDFAELRAALGNVAKGSDHVVLFLRDGETQTATLEQPAQ
ncbi:MAG: serine protease Do [Candidatus Sumerlaeota bacterium]|nr:serine protease Do [Candidatus Sumerlaeota bacterium]